MVLAEGVGASDNEGVGQPPGLGNARPRLSVVMCWEHSVKSSDIWLL